MTEPTQSPAGAYMGTCIHESSHAGAAHLLGMNVECVRIAEDGSGEMGLTPVASTHPPPVETAEREIQIAQAGAIAEYRYCEAVGYPEDKGRHTSWGEKPDKKRAWEVALRATTQLGSSARIGRTTTPDRCGPG